MFDVDPHRSPSDPERTCVGCRERGGRSVLVRVALSEGRLTVDDARVLPGRGAWLHPSGACLALAVKRKSLGRALRVPDADPSVLADHLSFAHEPAPTIDKTG